MFDDLNISKRSYSFCTLRYDTVSYIRCSIQRINETYDHTSDRDNGSPLSPYLRIANNASEIKTLFARYTYIAWHSVYGNDGVPAFGIVYACAKEREGL